LDLFEFEEGKQCRGWREELCAGAVVLRSFAMSHDTAIFAALHNVIREAPFRHMVTPGGFRMSVAMTNCGSYGWLTDRTGYRYDATEPESGKRWPRMPGVFLELAQNAATSAGFEDFEPDACLVNRYEPGARLSLHQDKNEHDFSAPIVSVSLGIPAVFLWGACSGKTSRFECNWRMAMLWYGAGRPGCVITEFYRSRKDIIRWQAVIGSI